jgi:uncharacterized protein (TIGR00725 family)
MKYVIGVFGSAAGKMDNEVLAQARETGRQIAAHGCITLTGACPGIPYEAIQGAKEVGGLTVGISPAESLKEHVERYKFPTDNFDVLIYTGFGKKGRNVVSLNTADAAVAIAGRIGTLNELTIAYDQQRLIGILDVPGLAIKFPKLAEESGKAGAKIIVEKDPRLLIDGLLKILEKK